MQQFDIKEHEPSFLPESHKMTENAYAALGDTFTVDYVRVFDKMK